MTLCGIFFCLQTPLGHSDRCDASIDSDSNVYTIGTSNKKDIFGNNAIFAKYMQLFSADELKQ